ncbi:MAG: flagellar biosynthesis protein FlhB [Zetaproteobacteria bacterium]|nr:MAG: flagellar biosynthesis protein FlhB [Zetaproteobacteria bacterium]
MAEEQDKSQQTEEPTSKRLSDAREKGQVPNSKEPSTAVSFLMIASLLVTGVGGWIYGHSSRLMERFLAGSIHVDWTPEGMVDLLITLAGQIALMVLPVALPVVALGMLVTVLVTGPVFALETLQPKFSRINPISGLGRLFSSKGLAELVKSVLKLVLIGAICWYLIASMLPLAVEGIRMDVAQIGAVMARGTVRMAAMVAALFVALALADVLYQRWEYLRSLRMSMKEIKDENKETEGDPLVKSKIKQLQREMAQRRMMEDVPKADVVITNPTHYAVALKYELGGSGAPVVVAKGADRLAQRIREIALEHGVPIRENKPLARSLFAHVEIGQEIPEELFEAVAVILAEIYRMKQML